MKRGTYLLAGLLALAGCSVPVATEPGEPVSDAGQTEVDGTKSQNQALESAKQYLALSGFSKQGLKQQLTSSAGDGFTESDAEFALNHVSVDWNAEAVESAEEYLATSAFSRKGLIEQLSSKAGSGFTRKQAEYAVNKVGL